MPKQVSYTESSWGWFFSPSAWGYPAIIVWVMELGTEMKSYKDQDPRPVEEIKIAFEFEAEVEKYDSEKQELTGEMEERVGIVWQNYTPIVSDKSNLGKVIKAVYDVQTIKEIRGFSLDKLLGLKCYVEVDLVGKEKNIPVIKAVSSLNPKMEKLLHEQQKESFYFWLEDADDYIDGWETDLKDCLKPWDIDRIKDSQEYRSLMAKFGIEVPETLEEQEENMKKEAEERKAEQAQADAEPTVSEDEAKDIFADDELPTEEPETTTKAREEAKAESTPEAQEEAPAKDSSFE